MVLDLSQIIAHRGASAYAPENTLAAFNKARALGARWIELDVQCCADGKVFVFHDESLARTSNGHGKLVSASSELLEGLDAGSWFSRHYKQERIPSFRVVLEWFATHDVCMNVEIKASTQDWEATTLAVLRDINRYWPQSGEQILVSSFNPEVLRLCARLMPQLPRALLLDKWSLSSRALYQELNCNVLVLAASILTPSRLRWLKSQGITVWVYTVNRAYLARRYFAWGVDAVFSNYPDLLTRPVFHARFQQALIRIFSKRLEKNLDKTR